MHALEISEDRTMPPAREPRRENNLSPEMLRELLEEYRQGTAEVIGLRNDFGNIKLAIEELTRAVRGGDGQRGLVTETELTSERLRRMESELAEFAKMGTPASRSELHVLETREAVARDQAARIEVRLAALEEANNRRDQRSIARGWQLMLFIGGQLIALVLGGVATLLTVFQMIFHK